MRTRLNPELVMVFRALLLHPPAMVQAQQVAGAFFRGDMLADDAIVTILRVAGASQALQNDARAFLSSLIIDAPGDIRPVEAHPMATKQHPTVSATPPTVVSGGGSSEGFAPPATPNVPPPKSGLPGTMSPGSLLANVLKAQGQMPGDAQPLLSDGERPASPPPPPQETGGITVAMIRARMEESGETWQEAQLYLQRQYFAPISPPQGQGQILGNVMARSPESPMPNPSQGQTWAGYWQSLRPGAPPPLNPGGPDATWDRVLGWVPPEVPAPLNPPPGGTPPNVGEPAGSPPNE